MEKGCEAGRWAFTIALCNPQVQEKMYFPGFPFFIFDAFKQKIRRQLQREFGVVLTLTDEGFINVHGEELGVASMLSKIHNMYSLSRNTSDKELQAAARFDRHVRLNNDVHAEDLCKLTSVLKKDLLEILDIPLETSKVPSRPLGSESMPVMRNVIPPKTSIPPKVSSIATPSLAPIEICSSNDSESDDSEVYISDDDEDLVRLQNDGPYPNGATANLTSLPIDFNFPPNFAIKEWMKANYEGTSNSADFVNKSDLLQHFQSHYDIPDHPDLANTFFDRLAVRIFPSDNNYRSVKTKRTKSKHSKRRLICLRRRNTDNDENKIPASSNSESKLLPKPVASLPPLSTAGSSSTMQEWNMHRSGISQAPVQPVLRMQKPQVSPVTYPAPVAPYQITQHHPKRQAPTESRPNVQQWMSTGAVSRPIAAKRTQRPNERMDSSLIRRIADMTDQELVGRPRPKPNPELRPIVIDGSNVAVTHGTKEFFSCRGIALCARYFIERGHGDITCFIPNYRKGGGGNPPASKPWLLEELEKMGILKYTPSRRIGGRNVVCYDDKFVVELAEANGAAIVSNDQYRDLMMSNPEWKTVIERQLLQFTLVGDLFMFPRDPLGRNGPTLDEFLKLPMNERKLQQRSPQRAIPGLTYSHPPSPPRRNTPPMNNIWSTPRPAFMPQSKTLSPEQSKLVHDMAELLPDKEPEIRDFVTKHPHIKDLALLMEIFLQISD